MSLAPPASIFTPLSDNQNAVLVFDISTVGGTTDAFGNYIPSSTTTTVNAIMHQTGDRLEAQLGADLDGVLMRGTCTSPTTLPSTVYQGMKAKATINGVTGIFTLITKIQNPYTESVAGEKFIGVFLREGE